MSLLRARPSLQATQYPWFLRSVATQFALGWSKALTAPARNVTGILFNQNVLGAKRIELLREISPKVSRIALLINPTNPNVKIEEADAEAGAKKLGLETVTLNATNTRAKWKPHSSSC